jgi:MoxR-like ATPase
VVGASNELPESDELVALFDRFLIRKEVSPVSDEGILQLLSMSNPGESSCKDKDNGCEIPLVGDLDAIIKSLSLAAENIVMGEDACELMRDLRVFMREKQNVEISDRRLVKVTRLLKICAATDGRKKVDTIDFLVTQHCFWNEPEERSAIRDWLWDNLTPMDRNDKNSLSQMRFLLENLRNEILSVLRKTGGQIDGNLGAKSEDIASIDALREESNRIAIIMQQKLNGLARHLELVRSDDFTWVDPDDAKAMRQLLLPRGELVWPEVKRLAEDAWALSLAISPSFSSNLSHDIRLDVIELLWDDDLTAGRGFTEAELELSMKEAKAKYDLETFRRWKRAKKKVENMS